MPKKAWSFIENIPSVDWIFTAGIHRSFFRIGDYGAESHFSESLSDFSKFNWNQYFYQDEFDKTQDYILAKVKNDIDWAFDYYYKTEQAVEDYFKIARVVEKTDLIKLSNSELADLWEKLFDAKELSHSRSVVITWILDSGIQPYTQYIMNIIKRGIKISETKIKLPQALAILTTPTGKSYSNMEREDFLNFALKKRSKINKLSEKDLKPLAKKYGWLEHSYIDDPKSQTEYLEEVKKYQKGLADPQKELDKLLAEREKNLRDQQKLSQQLGFSEVEKKQLDFARRIVAHKNFRKEGQYFGSFMNQKIFAEIARRFNINTKTIHLSLPWEVKPAILAGKFDTAELEKRYGYSILHFYDGGKKYKLYTGDEGRKFRDSLKFAKENISSTLKGMSAYPGKVTGTVKIVNSKADISKVEEGDVLVAHVTYPVYLPAMARAAAFVTDEGGLTSHAAIMAREFKKPTVVGTKTATKSFRDGDKVQVDANRGIVHIII
jgi:phosphohistidine swiveling domain-containing protein